MRLRAAMFPALLAVAACRAEGGRAGAAAADSGAVARAADTAAATIDGCRQTRGARADSTIRPGDLAAAEAWRRAFARGAEYRCAVHPSLPTMRLVVAGDTTGPSLDSLLLFLDSTR